MERGNGTGGIYKTSPTKKDGKTIGRRRKPYRAVVTVGRQAILNGVPVDDISSLDDEELLQVKYKQIRKNIGYFKTKHEAEEALADYFMFPETANNMTLEQIYNKWSESYYNDIAKSTEYGHKRAWKRLESIHGRKIKELHTPELESIINHLDCTDVEKNSARNLLNLLYDEALRLGIVQTNFSRNVKKQKTQPKKVQRPFTDDEIKELRKSSVPVAKLVLCMIYSGFRIREMLNIEIVEQEGYKCFKGGSKTEAGRDRIVPIHSKIEGIADYVVNEYNESINHNYDRAKNDFNKLREELGFTHVFHDTRATFSTKCDEYRVEPVVMKQLMGHAVDDITEKYYTRRTVQRLKEQIEKIK